MNFPEIDREQLVQRIAGRIFRTLSVRSQARLRELVAAGMLAIRNVDESFDASRGISFASFLKHRIHFAMFEALREFENQEHTPTAA